MELQGSTLLFPFQSDGNGQLSTIARREDIVAQSIADIVETRQGERPMMPDYGLPDFIFDVIDSGFAARVAYFAEQQVMRYEPLVEKVKVKVGALIDGEFELGIAPDNHRAAILINFTLRGAQGTRILTYPLWELARNG